MTPMKVMRYPGSLRRKACDVMRRLHAAPLVNEPLILVTCVVCSICAPVALAQVAPVAQGSGVYRIIDGDTIELTTNGQKIGIGMVGVRAPRGNSACGRLATARLRELSAAGLQFEEQTDLQHERYRRLYYMFTPAGQSVAEQMVEEGLLRANGRGRERAALETAENEARASGRGCLWQ